MKKITCLYIYLFLFVITSSSFAQETKLKASTESDKVFTIAEQMPEFIGGEKKLFEFITTNLKYPTFAKEKDISGKVYVTFIVDKSGKVRDAKILRGIGGGCDEEVLRVVGIMPDWNPGMEGGKAVSVIYNLPVNFTLKETKTKKEK